MGNGAIIVPLHDFKRPTQWYCRIKEIKKYGLGAVSNGITSIPNFMKIRPAIL
jgi:hypothetical protein